MSYLRMYQQPQLADWLDEILGANQGSGDCSWGYGPHLRTPQRSRCGFDPHMMVFQYPSASQSTCRRRCSGKQGKQQRPEVWEDAIDVSKLRPETIRISTEEGKLVVRGSEATEGNRDVSRHVQLPDGLITQSLKCYLAGEQLHVLGLTKPQKSQSQPEKPTGETTEQTTEKTGSAPGAESQTSASDAAETDPKTKEDDVPESSETQSNQPQCPCACTNAARCSQEGRCTRSESCKEGETDSVEMDFEFVSKSAEDGDSDGESLVVNVDGPKEDTAGSRGDLMLDTQSGGLEGSDTKHDGDAEDAVNSHSGGATPRTTHQLSTPHQGFHQSFNIQGFEPSEMKVTLNGRQLTVTAEHKEETDDFVNFRQFRKTINLPDDVILADVTSRLGNDGMLEISAPLQLAVEENGERELTIQMEAIHME